MGRLRGAGRTLADEHANNDFNTLNDFRQPELRSLYGMRTMSERTGVGHRIRAARERLGWTREQLAEHLGVHAGSVARWETGGSVPHAYTLARIAGAAGTTEGWLRTGDGPRPAADDGGEAEDVFGSLDQVVRFVEGMGAAGEERLRKLDALEGLRRMLTARGRLPAWWYDVRDRVEHGEL